MKSYQILIPIKDNFGNAFEEHIIDMLKRKFLESFTGYTEQGTYKGAWANNEGHIFYDESISFVVATDDVQAIKDIMNEMNSYFKQESYFISCVSNEVIFHSPIKE